MSCDFYKYDNSFFNGGYYCMLKKDHVNEDTYYKYCRNYDYRDCPIYKSKNSPGGCYLTSACVSAKGLPDDCMELETLRSFRDNWLKEQSCGECLIKRYYEIAPQIVAAIDAKEDCKEIYEDLYKNMVEPCVAFIQNKEYEKALKLYQDTTEILEKKYC